MHRGRCASIRLLANLVQMVMIFLFGVMGLVGVIIAYSFKDSR